MPPFSLLILLCLSQVQCTQNTVENTVFSQPGYFVPGFLSPLLPKAGEPVHPRFFMIDHTASYPKNANFFLSTFCDRKYFMDNFANASDVEIAAYVFQIDSLIDFLVSKKHSSKPSIEKLRKARKSVLECIQEMFPHRKLLLDLVAVSPSLRVQKVTAQKRASNSSPWVCLQQADYLSSLSSVNSFDVFNLKCALIGLLSSNLSDSSMLEHEKQLWVSHFMDSYFWMSSSRIATCISAMLRGMMYSELLFLNRNFTQEQWTLESFCMPFKEADHLPCEFRMLMTKTPEDYVRILLDKVFHMSRSNSCTRIAEFLDLHQSAIKKSDNTELLAFYESIDQNAFKQASSLLDFCIVMAFLANSPKVQSNLRTKYASFLKMAMLEGPVGEVFSAISLQLPSERDFYFAADGTVSFKMSMDILAPIAVGWIRNIRPVVAAYVDMQNSTKSLVLPEDTLAFSKCFTYDDIFLTLCRLICRYEMRSDDLESGLKVMKFVEAVTTLSLLPQMKIILLEGVIGMYLCRNRSRPSLISGIKVEPAESLSLTVGQLRGVKKKASISEYLKFMKTLISSSDNPFECYSSAYALLLWAILPRILNEPAGAEDVLMVFKATANLRSNKQFLHLERTAVRMILEHTPVERIRKILPSLLECGIKVDKVIVDCALSAHKRASLISDLFDLEVSKFNLSLLLTLKHPADENSITQTNLGAKIAAAIKTIAQGERKFVYLLTKSNLTTIFLTSSVLIAEVRHELGYRMHLPLIPKEIRVKIIELLCNDAEHENGNKESNSSTSSSISLLPISTTKQVEADTEQTSVPQANLQTENTIAKRDNASESDAKVKNTIAKSLVDLERPSRSRPRKTVQLSEEKANLKNTKKEKSHSLSSKKELKEEKCCSEQSESCRSDSLLKVSQPLEKQLAEALQSDCTVQPGGQFLPNDDISKNSIQATPVVDLGKTSRTRRRRRANQQSKDKLSPKSTNEENPKEQHIQSEKSNTQFNEKSKQEQKDCNEQSKSCNLDLSLRATPSLDEQVEIKTFKLTNEVLRNNSTINAFGQVVLNDDCLVDVVQYIREEVIGGSLPFQLDSKFLLFLTEGKHKDQFKNLGCKPIKNWKTREIWRPKLYTPIRVYGKGKEMSIKKITEITEFVYDLTKEQVARLQSLCYYSSFNSTKRNLLKFDVSSEYLKYQVNNGWIQIPQFPKTFGEFSDAIAALTNSLATTSSEVIGRAAMRSNVSKFLNVQRTTAAPVDSNSLATSSVHAVSLLDASNTKADVPLLVSSLLGNSSSQQQMTLQLKDFRTSPNAVEANKSAFNQSNSSNTSSLIETTTPLTIKSNNTVAELKAESVVFVPETDRSLGFLKNSKSPNIIETKKSEYNHSNSSKSAATSLIETTTKSPLAIKSDTTVSKLKADSTIYVPETNRVLTLLDSFTKMKHSVTPSNYKQKMSEFSHLLQSGVEYIALDCEMTGLYTREDEEEHMNDRSLVSVDNTNKLIEAVGQNTMFQLGLTVKTLDGKFSVWSFYTAPYLSVLSFTPATFNFLFATNEEPSEEEMSDIEAKIRNIASNYVSVYDLLVKIFSSKIPLILFSGFVDLMHVRKAVNQPYMLKHQDFELHLESDFYDVKQIALNILHKSQSLELLVQELYDGLKMNADHLHDASFDSLLTALAFDKLKKKYGADRMTKRLLFNYENYNN